MKFRSLVPSAFRGFRDIVDYLNTLVAEIELAVNSIEFNQREDTRNDKVVAATDVNGQRVITFDKGFAKEPIVVPYIRDSSTGTQRSIQVLSFTITSGKYASVTLQVLPVASGILVGALVREQK